MGSRMDHALQWIPGGAGPVLGVPYFGDTEDLFWDALAWLEER